VAFFGKTSKEIGDIGESKARSFLEDNGAKIIESNFTCKTGEIDIIAISDDTLLFVEVKYRKNNNFGDAAEMVTARKQKKIILTAQWYLQKHSRLANKACRFDVISIHQNEINWIQDAFGTDI